MLIYSIILLQNCFTGSQTNSSNFQCGLNTIIFPWIQCQCRVLRQPALWTEKLQDSEPLLCETANVERHGVLYVNHSNKAPFNICVYSLLSSYLENHD